MSQRIAAFDLDGTLITTKSGGLYPRNGRDWQFAFGEVESKLRLLVKSGYVIAVISNQGAIKSAVNGKKAAMVRECADGVLKKIFGEEGASTVALFAAQKNEFRKPDVGMWKHLLRVLQVDEKGVDMERSFFVGDAAGRPGDHSDVDSGFARAAGLTFFTPEAFFEGDEDENEQSQTSKKMQRHGNLPQWPQCDPMPALPSSSQKKNGMVLLLVGIQGAGKSTFCQKLDAALRRKIQEEEEEPKASAKDFGIINQDTIHKGRPGRRQQCIEEMRSILSEGGMAVVDRTNLTITQRKYFVEVAAEYQSPVHCLVFDTVPRLCRHRICERTEHPGGFQGKGMVHLLRFSENEYQVPSKEEEGLSFVSVTSGTGEMTEVVEAYAAIALDICKVR